MRKKRKAARLLSCAWQIYKEKKAANEDRAKPEFESNVNHLPILETKHTSPKKRISNHAKYLASESYSTMLENESLGEICVVENCFIMIGANP